MWMSPNMKPLQQGNFLSGKGGGGRTMVSFHQKGETINQNSFYVKNIFLHFYLK